MQAAVLGGFRDRHGRRLHGDARDVPRPFADFVHPQGAFVFFVESFSDGGRPVDRNQPFGITWKSTAKTWQALPPTTKRCQRA
jgi:hypothetical protein